MFAYVMFASNFYRGALISKLNDILITNISAIKHINTYADTDIAKFIFLHNIFAFSLLI